MKYMIMMPDADHVLISNNKSKLEKAYIIAIGEEYKAYQEACKVSESQEEITLKEMLEYSQVEAYDQEMINTYKFTTRTI